MSKLKLLILDANVVIFLHENGLWAKFIATCEVYLPRTVVDESAFFDDDNQVRHYIDLEIGISRRQIDIFDVSLLDLQKFQQQFDPFYISQIDPGELEALAYLCASKQDFLISSGDAIVYRVLGVLSRADQGISLEELLSKIGLKHEIGWQFTKKFREKYTQDGFTDLMQNRGLKKMTYCEGRVQGSEPPSEF